MANHNNESSRNRPNIVLFVAEDLDYEGLGCYDAEATGYSGLIAAGNQFAKRFEPHTRTYTPTIDGLAERGFKANRFYCPSAICTPARYSLMTGRYPERSREFCDCYPPEHQANIFFNTPISREETNLAKSLQASGYTTGIVGKWHNYPQGIKLRLTDLYRSIKKDADPRDPEVSKTLNNWYNLAVDYLADGFGWDSVDRIYFDNPEPFLPDPLGCHNLEWIIEGALNFLDWQSKAEGPFFLYVPITVPHSRYGDGVLDSYDPLATPSGMLDERPRGMASRESVKERIESMGLPGYAAEGLWMDEGVKAILDRLDSIGKRDETCFMFVSDHPTAGKQTCHLGRIPYIVDWPGKTDAQEVDQLLSTLDLAPTLLDIAGASAPRDMRLDGLSFKSLLLGESISEERESLLLEVVNSRGIVYRNWKYIANRIPPEFPATGAASESGWYGGRCYDNSMREKKIDYKSDQLFPSFLEEEQLYDIESDPLEQTNLAYDSDYQFVLSNMKERLKAELRKMPHRFGELTDQTVAMGLQDA